MSLRIPRSRFRRLFQYKLRTLLILTTIIAAGFAWWSHTARKQRIAVAALQKAGAKLTYSFQDDWDPKGRPDWPTWLVDLLGVDYFGHVRNVNFWVSFFGNANVTDADLEYLQNLPGLESFSARSEEVTDAGMAHIQRLTSLKEAYLIFPRVTDGGIANLKHLKNLEVLYLSETQVSDAGLKHLQGLTRLKKLYMGSSEWQYSTSPVTNAGLAHLKGLQSLETLCLDDTQITDSGLTELAALPELQTLTLNRTRITDIGLAKLKALKKLKKLELEGTWVTDAGILQLRKLKGMQDKSPSPWRDDMLEIKLDNTYVTEAGADKLRLLLPNTDIQWSEADRPESDRDLVRLAALGPDTLESLEVGVRRKQAITDAGLAHLVRFKSLKALTIRGSNFTDAGLIHLAALTKLHSLDLTDSSFTENGIERLQQQLPNCEIQWLPPDPPEEQADSPP